MRLTARHTYGGGYISLPISLPNDLPKTITYRDEVYHLKDEFHISLVCVKRLRTMVEDLGPEIAENKMMHLFKEFNSTSTLDKYNLTGELRHVTKDERKTIAAMTHVDELNELFDFINSRLNASFAVQPGHVTLYTLQPNKGIGILNDKEIIELTEAASIPELSAKLK